MNRFEVKIIEHTEELPALNGNNFFHSRELFELTRKTPRQKPYMVLIMSQEGHVVAHLLGIVRYRASWLPPYFFMHCRVLGEGDYQEDITAKDKAELFQMMLHALRKHLGNRVLYIEVSNLSQKMFAYKEFRQQQFFPVRWMSIHNSLHSRLPEERINDRMKKRIETAYQRGVTTGEVESEEDFVAFSKLLRRHHWLKPKRYIPSDIFFRSIMEQQLGRLYVTKYHDRVIGCSAVAYSSENAYLWYSAFRRKSFAFVHPDLLTIWHAIKDAHQRGYQHIFFLDVGLPFRKNPFREFILSFGGKPVSTHRWFRCSIKWINSFLTWIYRD